MIASSEIYNYVIKSSAFDYAKNSLSEQEIKAFELEVLQKLNIQLEKQYLGFLQKINGFLHNFSFYGTTARQKPQIYSALEESIFWQAEIPKLKGLYIFGESDMDFYCYEPISKKYLVLDKGACTTVETHDSFEDIMLSIKNIYYK